MNTTFLVGGLGQIGTVLKDHLIKQNEYAVITSRYKNKKTKKENIKIINLNINNKDDIKKKLICTIQGDFLFSRSKFF